MSRKSPKYKGVLSKPIILKAPNPFGGEWERQQDNNRATRDIVDRLDALYEHYKINQQSPSAQIDLILSLAREFVPGFKFKTNTERRVGKPTKWRGNRGVELYADVRRLVLGGQSEENACRLLTTMPQFKVRYSGEKHSNLNRRFIEIRQKNPLVWWRLLEPAKPLLDHDESDLIDHFAVRADIEGSN